MLRLDYQLKELEPELLGSGERRVGGVGKVEE